MKNWTLLAILATTLINNLSSQQNYTVSWGNSSYDTLENARSIMYDLLPYPSISSVEMDIDFGFNFVFFDSLYSSVILDGDGVGYFEDSYDYNFFLFAGEFESHEFSGLPIHSDWRFKIDSINGVKILKVEWKDVGIYDDITSTLPSDSRINFQVWFFESGTIEIHFGEIVLSNSVYYSDTNGFIWDDGYSYGPWIGITNSDLSEVYYVTGTNDSINIVNSEDEADIYYSIPPVGQYFRFTPNEISSLSTQFDSDEIYIYPNPTAKAFWIKNESEANNSSTKMMTVQIIDATGNIVKLMEVSTDQMIDISKIPSGMYFVKLSESNSDIVKRILKFVKP